jgi:hypothetical protein
MALVVEAVREVVLVAEVREVEDGDGVVDLFDRMARTLV